MWSGLPVFPHEQKHIIREELLGQRRQRESLWFLDIQVPNRRANISYPDEDVLSAFVAEKIEAFQENTQGRDPKL